MAQKKKIRNKSNIDKQLPEIFAFGIIVFVIIVLFSVIAFFSTINPN